MWLYRSTFTTRIAPHTSSFSNNRLHHWCLAFILFVMEDIPNVVSVSTDFLVIDFSLDLIRSSSTYAHFFRQLFSFHLFQLRHQFSMTLFFLVAKLDTHNKHLHHLPAFLVYQFFHHESKSETFFLFSNVRTRTQTQTKTQTHTRIHPKQPRIISRCKL